MALNQPNEDLFEGTRMSFGEHLEELRVILVRAMIGIAIGCVIGLWQGDNVVKFIQKPLTDAIQDYNKENARLRIKEANNGVLPPEIVPLLNDDDLIPRTLQVEPRQLFTILKNQFPDEFTGDIPAPYRFSNSQIIKGKIPTICKQLEKSGRAEEVTETKVLWEALSEGELKTITRLSSQSKISKEDKAAFLAILNRLIELPKIYQAKVFAEKYKDDDTYQSYSEQLAKDDSPDMSRRLNRLLVSGTFKGSLKKPSLALAEIQVWETSKVRTQALNPQEVFMIWLKASFITGFVIASPWVFYQIWAFVAAGLFPHEKHYVHLYLPISIGLFMGGASLAFFGVFQPVLDFLFKFNRMMGIDPEPRIGEWLGFVMFMPLGFGIAFQLPLVMLFLNRIGVFSTEIYLEKWRIAILVISVLSMVLTPADPISMLMLAIPLIILYFGGVALCKWMPTSRNPFSEAYDPS